jgi:colicin import membrane protein
MSAAAIDDRSSPRAARSGERTPTSFALALLMHALLFGGMTLAVQWRTQPSGPVVAELWAGLPPPQVVPPPVEPAALRQPEPTPAPVPVPEPKREPEIAIERERKAPQRVEPRPEERRPPPKKAPPETKKAAPEPRKAAAEPRKAAPEPAPETPQPRTDLERLMAQAKAGTTPAGAPVASASGVRGADGDFSARVIACIRPHVVFVVPAGTSPTVHADFRVELLPDGSVAAVRLLRASGLAGYDAAAERAIRRCDPFPRKRDGSVERVVDVRMSPVEAR